MKDKKSENRTRVIVIGLDGASWNVIMPLARKGKLPTLEKLIIQSSYGYLESIIPPVSVPAWKCYSTGRHPGKLGVYSLLLLDLDKKKYKAPSSSDFDGKDIWDYLGEYDLTSCVYKMFSTHPAKKIKGALVSDIPNTRGFYPKELRKELEELFGSLFFEFDFVTRREDTYYRVLSDIEKDFEVVKYLMSKYNPNFTHITICHTDGIQHFFWGDMKNNDAEYGKFIENAWIQIDRQLGEFINYLIEQIKDFYLFLMSDHGFTAVDYRFNIGKWLLDRGYLKLTNAGKLSKVVLAFIKNVDKIFVPMEKALNFVRDISKEKGNRRGVQLNLMKDSLYEQIIDWRSSKVVPLEGRILYLNEEGFGKEEDMAEFASKLIEEISRLKRPDSKPLTRQIFNGKEIYSDDKAPDILILPKNINMYNAPPLGTLWSKPSEDKWTGMHALHGIFLAFGPEIKGRYQIEGARILDIAPTILHILGVPIPKDMDGSVLKEIFEEGSELAKRPIVWQEPEETEKQRLKRKMKSLKRAEKV